jgi:hypothetical protein
MAVAVGGLVPLTDYSKFKTFKAAVENKGYIIRRFRCDNGTANALIVEKVFIDHTSGFGLTAMQVSYLVPLAKEGLNVCTAAAMCPNTSLSSNETACRLLLLTSSRPPHHHNP